MIVATVAPIVISVIAAFFMGFLWYSPIFFGETWMKLEFPYKTKKELANLRISPGILMSTVFAHCVTFSVIGCLANYFTRAASVQSTLGLGVTLATLVFSTQLPHTLFGKKPITLYLIHHGYDATCIMIGCFITGVWNQL